MNKKKFVVLTLFVLVLFTLAACFLAACNPSNNDDATEEEVKATEGLLISNSDFKVLSQDQDEFPKRITNWTGAKMYSSSSFRDDVTAGAISLADDLYSQNKSSWDDSDDVIKNLLKAGGRYGEDDKIKNAMMVYMPEESTNSDGDKIHGATAYGFTSSSFTLNKGSYYELSVDVLTYNIKGDGKSTSEPGARIYVQSNTYAEFAKINTNGQWETYKIYIETSPSASTSLTLMLGLGKYTASYTNGLTTGYAFFDNVVLTALDDKDTDEIEGADKFQDAIAAEKADGVLDGAKVATTTLKVPNGRFDFGSLNTSTNGTPNSWSIVAGNSGKDDQAPSNSVGWNAVIDSAKFGENYKNYSSTFKLRAGGDTNNRSFIPAEHLNSLIDPETFKRADSIGTNVFMLSQQYMTAQGVRTSRNITIEKGKTYALSIWLYAADIHGDGVSLILSGSNSKDIVIKGIARNKSDNILIGNAPIEEGTGFERGDTVDAATMSGWQQYTFYIKGNQYSDYTYNMTVWLGTGGTSDNYAKKYHNFTNNSDNVETYTANGTFSNGWVFMDDLALEEITSETFTSNAHENGGVKEEMELDVDGSLVGASIAVDLSTPDKENSFKDVLENGSNSTSLPTDATVKKVGEGAPTGWTSNVKLDDERQLPLTDGNIYEGIVNLSSKDTFASSLIAGDIEGAVEYPSVPYANMPSQNAYMIYATSTGYYEVESNQITVKANSFYRISFWLKTSDIKAESGAYVSLLDKTSQEKDNKEKSLTSFTKINTTDTDAYLKDWVELIIVVRGGENDTNVALKFTLGTGDRFAATTRTSGAMFVTNFNLSSITYANFTATTTSTYTQSVNLSTKEATSSTFTNSSFNSYDHDDENIEAGKPLEQQSHAAMPESWTINDNTLDVNKDETTAFAGVIALTKNEDGTFTTSDQATSVTGLDVFDNFYGYPTSDDYYDAQNLESIAGPNILALGSKDSEKYAFGFASSSFTLSADTFYKLSVYARTEKGASASIFLTGESSSVGENSFELTPSTATSADGKWTKFTFYIEVGKTSVSVKLNLWLGKDVQYQSRTADQESLSDDEFAELFKSSGAVFFDNVTFETIEEYEYQNAETNDTQKTLSFTLDSFDALSSTVESRASLSTPTGWTGAAGTNQSSSNTISGVVYANSNYYESKLVGETNYVGILGKDYDEESVTISSEELAAGREEYPGDINDADLIELLEREKRTDLKMKNWIPVEMLQTRNAATANNWQMLVINNTSASAYTYTSSNNTFKENSYYKVSVFVRTYGVGAGEKGDDDKDLSDEEFIEKQKAGAYIELYLGSANESTNPMIFEHIITDNSSANQGWEQYTFLVRTRDADVTSVSLRLSLGKYFSDEVDGKTVITGLTNGYAMFDDVSIEKLEDEAGEAEYNRYEEMTDEQKAEAHVLTRYVKAETSGNPDEDEETETPSDNRTFNLDYLWWMIPTIVLGVIIIAVVVVFIVRKVKKPNKQPKTKTKKTSAPIVTQTLDEKHDKYDEDKE